MTVGHIDPSRLQQSLDALRERGFTHDLPRSMEALVSAAQDLFSVTGAGLLLADADRVLRYVAATDEAARILEEAQEQAGTGPCVESLVLNQLVQTTDLPSDPRWPGLLSDYPEAGIRAVLGVPVRVAGVAVGSLNVYSDEPFDWDESDQKALRAYADLGESAMVGALHAHEQGRVVQQLEGALESRVVIERAVGVLMERHDLDAVAAFDRLRRAARDSRRRVRDLAQELLDGQEP